MKATPSHPAVPRHFRERGQDPDLDSGQRIRVERHPEEEAGTARRPVHHPAGSGSYAIHASVFATTVCGVEAAVGGTAGHTGQMWLFET